MAEAVYVFTRDRKDIVATADVRTYACTNFRKNRCVECGGSSMCEHKRRRGTCIECGGASTCVHKRQKAECIDCGGSNICKHKRLKHRCIECGGISICRHGLQKDKCKECPRCYIHLCKRPVAKSTGKTSPYQWQETEKPETGTEIYNDLLASALLEKFEFNQTDLDRFDQDFFYDSYIKVGEKYFTPAGTCYTCALNERKSRFKSSERIVHYSLKRRGITLTTVSRTGARKKKEMRIMDMLDTNDISQINDRTDRNRDSTCERSEFRPDFQVKHANDELVTIYIEVDEYQHKRTILACELTRLNDLLTSFQLQRHLVVLRYNPDPFNMGEKRITCKELPRSERENLLMRELNQVITQAADLSNFKDVLTVIYISFDCDCTTPCGYVHTDHFKDQKAISEAHARAGL